MIEVPWSSLSCWCCNVFVMIVMFIVATRVGGYFDRKKARENPVEKSCLKIMSNHFTLFLNTNCICSVLNKRPDHLRTRQSSWNASRSSNCFFCCKQLQIKMVKPSWNLIKFGKTTSQWSFFPNVFQLVLSKDTTASLVETKNQKLAAKKNVGPKHFAGPSETWGNGIVAARIEDGGTPRLWWWER